MFTYHLNGVAINRDDALKTLEAYNVKCPWSNINIDPNELLDSMESVAINTGEAKDIHIPPFINLEVIYKPTEWNDVAASQLERYDKYTRNHRLTLFNECYNEIIKLAKENDDFITVWDNITVDMLADSGMIKNTFMNMFMERVAFDPSVEVIGCAHENVTIRIK